jgi:small subunit ribosomal protein S23
MSKAKAYDQARQEFYDIRHQEDVERRVAREEALAVGAHFGKSTLDVGMELEDKAYEEWKAWAIEKTKLLEQARGSNDVSDAPQVEDAEEASLDGGEPELAV